MKSLLKITFLEIFAGVGWACLAALTLFMWATFPHALGAEGRGGWITRGQGVTLGMFIAGCYSVLLAARLGGAQVSRGANLYYRGCGIGELGRWMGISLACTFPLLASTVVGGGLLCINHWAWTGSFSGSVLAVAQFSLLFLTIFMAAVMPSVGIGAKLGETSGSIFGLVFLCFGLFFPTFFSIAVKENPGLEGIWAVLPHLYVLDWSPAVVNMWDPSPLGVFLAPLAYGLLWCLAMGGVGFLFFSSSGDSND